MFGIGGFELFIILIFGFLIFGPEKLPEIAKTVGKGIARFRAAQQEVNETIGSEKIFDPDNPDEPFKDPTVVLDKLAQKQEERRAAKAGGSANPAAAGASDDAGRAGNAVNAGDAGDAGDAGGAAAEPKQESFTERKARYERERAARKAAEKEAAEAAADEGGDA